MKNLMADVQQFHDAAGTMNPLAPSLLDSKTRNLRFDLIQEEVDELYDALYGGDIIAVADALADIIYVAVGAALAFGIPLDKVWAEVHRSNMTKVDPETGKMVKNDCGKIVKPERGYEPPRIAWAMGAGIAFE